jgi:hypothetical protein
MSLGTPQTSSDLPSLAFRALILRDPTSVQCEEEDWERREGEEGEGRENGEG